MLEQVDEPSERVLIVAPIGRDADLTRDLLARASIRSTACGSVSALCAVVHEDGCGAILLAEEALDDPTFPDLVTTLEQQPAWSDVPVLLFAGVVGSDMPLRAVRAIERLRNVTLLERPMRVAAVLSTVRAALRSRARQYEVRGLLVALHRARSDAESANRLKDEFLATLSHELRTPLNAILGWTSMLTHGQVEAERIPRVFEALDRNARAQSRLIADVLDVSSIIRGKLKLNLETVDVKEVMRRAMDVVRLAASSKSIDMAMNGDDECYVRGDTDRLQQIFWNLLSNAVKFTPTGGRVEIRVRRNGLIVSIRVSDTGVGITSDFMPFVFDRFRQADQTTTREHGGLGLGLAIVKHLVELHGGSVSAASAGRDHGARFQVVLPAVDGLPDRTDSAAGGE